MQRGHAIVIWSVGVEATGQHCFQNARIASLRWNVQHKVMFGSEFVPHARVICEHLIGSRPVAARTSGYEVFKRRKLVHRTVFQQPGGDLFVSIQ